MEYLKPHLTFNEQLEKLEGRGLVVNDRREAIHALKRIGYYRLSAYWYPLRLIDVTGTEARRRLDEFHPDATFDNVIRLYEFDAKLRSVLMQGLADLEIALRVRLAYNLGKIDPFGHLKPDLLDRGTTDEPSQTYDGTNYEAWRARYDKLCQESSNEDYVKHFREKYDGRLPIWTATELMDFGAIVRLIGFLPARDQQKIAGAFGLKRATDLISWSRSLNVVRNHCAHHARMWNRSIPYPPAKVRANVVPDRMAHLAETKKENIARVYYLAALLAGLLVQIVPATNWPRTFKTQARKLPEIQQVASLNVMGFPEAWESLDLWNYSPPASRA
ncbi:Abi family protein [Rhodococcus sp. NPDC059968]|uniref:Abi family protein n=1 Tax=Rhodococcus sp. NPDC059968 TaxID=3347017 RepID=UPI00366F10BC